jgi:hypothetical protein
MIIRMIFRLFLLPFVLGYSVLISICDCVVWLFDDTFDYDAMMAANYSSLLWMRTFGHRAQ